MLDDNDVRAIVARGNSIEEVRQQLENFRRGFPHLRVVRPATAGDGIIVLPPYVFLQACYRQVERQVMSGLTVAKFVPASGAASRMFKALYNAKDDLAAGKTERETLIDKSKVSAFHRDIKRFAFYDRWAQVTGKSPAEMPLREQLDTLLTPAGLDYGNLPKGLLLFHKYSDGARTPFEEHCIEGVLYGANRDNTVNIHFTVSPEHLSLFEALMKEVVARYERKFSVKFNISFSGQQAATDTIAVTPDNEPFRNSDGSLLFRPAGHGALLDNLNRLDADIVFIKNIDNVQQDRAKQTVLDYKRVLAGILLDIREQLFIYQQLFDERPASGIARQTLIEALTFVQKQLNVEHPAYNEDTGSEELYTYIKQKLNRPLRVCGMVKNEGEPGGGPFWAVNRDGSVSLQIAESSQIAPDVPEQQAIVSKATHFNPVDLVCSFKNYKGDKYVLSAFRDMQTGFISAKSKDGKELRAQELPGLWNGAMADWNTVFVETPPVTFSPVKTINDLLRAEHQPD
ncbi:MAG: DUF4301 family protein [Bacteroidales bacterium]|jgi:hypothetical protein|nr:DUF4301 family protein [Bacteroidales bacterium]